MSSIGSTADAPDDYARYEAMPVNATAQTFLLTRELARGLERRRVAVPVFMAQSADDDAPSGHAGPLGRPAPGVTARMHRVPRGFET